MTIVNLDFEHIRVGNQVQIKSENQKRIKEKQSTDRMHAATY